jgi:hypothetical protein
MLVRESSSALRGRIRKLAKQRLGEGTPLLKLQALLERAQRCTARRNELLHSVCGREIEETAAQLRNNDHTWKSYPNVSELNDLATELDAVTNELNEARLEGFIRRAMDERK